MKRFHFSGVLFVAVVFSSIAAAEDWTQFRGPRGDSVATAAKTPVNWAERSHVAWKVPLPGRGWSQPVVARGKVFVTTAVSEEEEKPRRGEGGIVLGAADSRKHNYHWKLLCLSADTGAVLWERTVHEGHPRFGKHRTNTFASETPATDGELLIAYFGMTGLSCYDAQTGKLHYQTRMPQATGCTASPWAAAGRVYCLDETGKTLVFEPGPEFKLVATNQLDEDMFWASPAFAGDRLILRSLQHLYCIADDSP